MADCETSTPPPQFYGTLTIENVTATFRSVIAVRRDAILMELAELERQLGYNSSNGNPTTSELRAWWRQYQGACPHCGKRVK